MKLPTLLLLLLVACAEAEPVPPSEAGDTGTSAALDGSVEADASGLDGATDDLGFPPGPEDAGGTDGPLPDATVTDATVADAGGPDASSGDPFAPQPDESEGLVNLTTDLEALMEHGNLEGACEAYEADPNDRQKMLLCGKSMFFFESFGTTGVPEVFIDFFATNFPEVGSGWSEFGMVPDPYSTTHRPLGFGPAPPLGNAPTLAFTCASCHFAQLPDGRYAVGAPNHRYDYGKMIATIILVPTLVAPNADPLAHDPNAVAFVQPILDRIAMDRPLRLRLLLALLPLVGNTNTGVTPAIEASYVRWLSGTQDFMLAPLPVDDEVITISKISALWGLPRPAEQANAGMVHAMLAWTGGTTSIEQFLEGFAILGTGDLVTWTPDRLRPLAEYIYSLRAPDNLTPPPSAEINQGRALFDSAGCLECHQGPRGSGLRLYDYAEIGTDNEMQRWADPDLDGNACCGFGAGTLTHQVKSPRLNGLHTFGRFLHNGSVPSLENLLCLDGSRGDVTEAAYGNDGHLYGCDLSEAERRALIAFMRSI